MNKPFLKWAGGKHYAIDNINAFKPNNSKRLVEPFVGSASVSIGININKFLLCDVNQDLVSLYKHLVSDPKKFIQDCRSLFVEGNNKDDVYYSLRKEFNTSEDSYRKSCLFVFINRHCFNGLMRYNASGLFNTPFGKYHHPYFPEKEMLFFADKFKNTEFKQCDFRKTFEQVVEGDFVYCDPPYVSIGKTSASFTAYAKEGFSADDQIQLANCCRQAADRGAVVVVSNHDTPESRGLYINADDIISLDVKRTIGGKGSVRGDVREVLVVYGKQPTGLFE
jgi:DNA adenine methylase